MGWKFIAFIDGKTFLHWAVIHLFIIKFSAMRSFGILFLILGIGSFILRKMEREFTLLQWVDKWGQSTGDMIRIGFAVLGVILIVLSFRKRN
jgi:hypothetical protein